MHDEATTHYIDMIDQTTLGHRFIKEEFGVTPRVGWQIDPFGHSAVQAYLLGAELGFDSLFFGRIDYQDRTKRKTEKSLEVIWQGSKSLGSSAQIFAGAFPENYEPPSGFYFEVNDASPIVQDDITLFDYNVQERVEDFVAAALSQIRDYRVDWDLKVNEPAAGNYYPINLGIYVKDNKKELSVLVDRAVGGSSLVDGQLELMLHRRLLRDDGKGVAEALNETVCIDNQCKGLTIQGKYYYKIDQLGEGAKWRRSAGQEIYSPFLLAFTEQDEDNWMSSHVPTFSAIDSSYSLPDNVAILTLQELTNKEVLLRLAHLYEIGEDKELSVMSQVELKKLFQSKQIGKVVEMSLSGNQERSEMEKRRLVWKAEGWGGESKLTRGGAVDPGELLVELAPMEIRTFVIHFDDMFIQDVGGGSTMLKSCL
ncbi:UNVERIFIED_CONTAM: Alpha-mannosidase [Sesamum radiatum]|uniref:alpha-mannosidase n=1 Tax=Sesamum radiatum TaxID=300843 RepID=A0AAW2P844_SESRA